MSKFIRRLRWFFDLCWAQNPAGTGERIPLHVALSVAWALGESPCASI